MDPKYNGQLQHGQLQHGWGWILAAYLFFGGLGAGAYVIAALNGLLGGVETAATVGLWIAFPAVLVGSVFLIADLGVPTRAILAGVSISSQSIPGSASNASSNSTIGRRPCAAAECNGV